MWNIVFQKIDTILNSIPYKIRKLIAIFSAITWIFLAIVVVIYSFLQGKKNAPIVGENQYLSELKEKIQKNKNDKVNNTIILPDLNDLVQQEIPLNIKDIDNPSEDIPLNLKIKKDNKDIPILSVEDQLIFPEKNEPVLKSNPDTNIDFLKEKKENPIPQQEPLKNKLDIIKIEN